VSTPFPAADAVRRGIARRFLKHGATVENAMTIIGPVLDWYDDEIRRLSAACEEEECAAILGEPPPGALL
jgi:hypothetical protein